MNKYDHDMIVKLYKDGISTERIAEIMGTCKFTIAYIIRKEQKRGKHKIHQHRRFEAEEEN